LAAPAWATEYGHVISSIPVVQQVPGPCGQTDSFNEAVPCQPAPPPQSQVVGYTIQYRYHGQTYSAQVASNPGPSVPLQFDPNTGSPIPALAAAAQNALSDDSYAAALPPPPQPYPPTYPAPYYDGAPYYGPVYYGPPVYAPPVVGVGIGFGFGGGGGGWHGHGGGHYR
jgi:hypothetical protein